MMIRKEGQSEKFRTTFVCFSTTLLRKNPTTHYLYILT